jgi:hypothetical protein
MARTTVEECRQLNIFQLNRQGSLYGNGDDLLYGTDVQVPLTKTPCYFGGFRWWFICPDCGKRMAILYKPRYSNFFLCRQCHNLTYKSCQEHGTSFEPFMKAFKISDRSKQIMAGIGQKGPSKVEKAQIESLMRKLRQHPGFLEYGQRRLTDTTLETLIKEL